MVIRDFKYTPEDVDCRFCTEFAHGRCKATKCPWIKERIEAGVVSYHEAVNESFEERSPLRKRINVVLSFYDKSFWRNDEHFHRLQQADAALGFYKSRNTSEYYATLFLLTADKDLLKRILDCFTRKGVDFSRADLHDISPENYTLYKIAKSIYTESGEVGVDELADPELVSTEVFHLVINAMLIYRYGLSALRLKREDGGYGCIIAQYVPYVLLSMEHAITMVKYHSNNRKHSKRNAEHSDAFGYDDGELEKYHPELIDDPFGQSANMDFLYEALDRLPESQRSRIQKYYMQDMSYVEIAADEGVSPQAVQQSIARSLIFLKKILAGR